MAAAVSGGSGGGRKGNRPPKKVPDDKPVSDSDDSDQQPDLDPQPDRVYCPVCNTYLHFGVTLKRHRRKYCVGPRKGHGDFRCLRRFCGARYRYYHDLQSHWKTKHRGVKQPEAMKKYIP